MRIAVIGSGIAGLSSAFLLSEKNEVHLYEKAPRLGGHTATHSFELGGKSYAIDTGFIVYNDWTYPNFIKLLKLLDVQTQKTTMGFSVKVPDRELEYAGSNFDGIFAQRKNLLSPNFLWMLREIVRFNKESQRDWMSGALPPEMTLKDYLKKRNFSKFFTDFYLVPMGAAIWSAPFKTIETFPAIFFIRFFYNHGLLSIKNRPQWRTIVGGSKQYIEPLSRRFHDNIHLNSDIKCVNRYDDRVEITFADETQESFDHVVMACHSDQALSLLGDPSEDEKQILAAIPYQNNSVVLHYDESQLPRSKRAWCSWNYCINSSDEHVGASTLPVLTYNMNILQNIESETTFCVTLNNDDAIAQDKTIAKFEYAHPQFSPESVSAQQRWDALHEASRTWYCGAYWANGFHEDGVKSAVRIAERFGISF